ncbi:MAG: recombinase family protein [[Clostridium] spiroforme]|uniref:recombinase family protein n=1 Tax=Thomasclavelia spiroformis TaxID=29348 RepID=UPI001D268080|nr:recombinase family protein [Thomasclavelia spiroformis]MBS7217741.1 recombinase family protein [Thomasclavelia spiroformis]
MKYGYARVSTVHQRKDGNSLEDQHNQLLQEGCDFIIEEQFSGSRMDRPKFKQLCDQLIAGDTLVVCKLDRFARTVVEGALTCRELMQRGIRIHILNMGIIEDSPVGRLILTTFLAFAEFERDIIRERTMAGKEVARQRPGYREGRPEVYTEEVRRRTVLIATELSVRMTAKVTGISRSTVQRWIDDVNSTPLVEKDFFVKDTLKIFDGTLMISELYF